MTLEEALARIEELELEKEELQLEKEDLVNNLERQKSLCKQWYNNLEDIQSELYSEF